MTNDEYRIPNTDLLNLNHDELRALLAEWGQPRYRADQIWHWLYVNLCTSPDQMTNLPQPLRARLAEETFIGGLTLVAQQQSSDGETVKWLFELPPPGGGIRGGAQVETVLMSYHPPLRSPWHSPALVTAGASGPPGQVICVLFSK
jgi:23S rRNA (adenine2503-C2)-methyltransferase